MKSNFDNQPRANEIYSYKIEVFLFPDNEYYPDKPYFWCMLNCDNREDADWCNYGAGWSESPQKAWDDAYGYYKKHIAE